MTSKSWFILRYNHFPPSTIILGTLITNPKEPHLPLFTTSLPFPTTMHPIRTTHESLKFSTSVTKEGHAGMPAQMDGLPLSTNISTEFARTAKNSADFQTLETQYILPNPEYEKLSMSEPSIKSHLGNKSLLLKSVFMITGVKIARSGGKTGRETKNRKEATFQVGITPTPAFPVSLGPDVGGKVEEEGSVSSSTQEDFVWAFSLRQIFYRWGEVKGSKTYEDGATLDGRVRKDGREGNEAEEDKEKEEEIEVDGSEEFNGEESRLVPIEEIRDVGSDLSFLLVENL
ncbi:hypothetical protein NA56DRAFT_642101 [Hyaloscypha hepaticicola]|uniref:Uncharacterized protein n=1 Tax=Hyaloscypha hepaticicola TaxID=2082293 RepID=A0A2J6QHT9_9HELO|nr:hypothetical protein NA56DRAFT_642101 [Hyaloscypha hepaticicola]